MKRLLALCGLSVALYALLFAFVLDRPLSLGLLRHALALKTARLASLASPKLVIIAGSNGPYSHACAVIGPMLHMACENAGVAVGIGLDNVFARDLPDLHEGDVVYLPMELQQYVITRAENRAAADAGSLVRHDRAVLARLAPDRVLGAVFCCNLADVLESVAEMPIAAAGLIRPVAQYNMFGDRIDNPLAGADKTLLSQPARTAPNAGMIERGYGTALIAGFVRTAGARGVMVFGGLPVDFSDAVLPPATLAAVADIYRSSCARFLTLPNHSRYPRADFFNGEDHLAQPCQFAHSIAIARLLGAALGRPVAPPAPGVMQAAGFCPYAK